jgi:hypothetical protein
MIARAAHLTSSDMIWIEPRGYCANKWP